MKLLNIKYQQFGCKIRDDTFHTDLSSSETMYHYIDETPFRLGIHSPRENGEKVILL